MTPLSVQDCLRFTFQPRAPKLLVRLLVKMSSKLHAWDDGVSCNNVQRGASPTSFLWMHHISCPLYQFRDLRLIHITKSISSNMFPLFITSFFCSSLVWMQNLYQSLQTDGPSLEFNQQMCFIELVQCFKKYSEPIFKKEILHNMLDLWPTHAGCLGQGSAESLQPLSLVRCLLFKSLKVRFHLICFLFSNCN